MLGPESAAFSIAAALTLPYDAAKLASRGVLEPEVQIYRWNPDTQDWQWTPAAVDLAARTPSANINRLSHYIIAARRAKK